jgi:mono/diheme cytochrome c family protein
MSRTQIEITLGILFILATSTIIVFYGLNEENRMADYAQSQRAHAIEVGADLFDQQCSRCHGPQGTGTFGLCPPLNDRYFFDQRLADVGWSSTLEEYIVATASGGRLASTRPDQYPGEGTPAMPAFSDHFGGPLREDQIRSIAVYIMNWEETATQIAAIPTPSGPPVGSDITQSLPEGDPQEGEAKATTHGCVTCHITAPTGPAWLPSDDQPGIGERAAARITEPDYTGNAGSPEQYLFESIVQPSVHMVDGFQDIMPKTYGGSLTAEDVADLIAYLMTLR